MPSTSSSRSRGWTFKVLSPSQKASLKRASETYAGQLLAAKSNGALPAGVTDYFNEHSITPTIASKYKIGYVAEPLPEDERFRGMISLPYLTNAGPVSIKYRSLVEGEAKYAQARGQRGRLYNALSYFTAGSSVAVSEGEVDALVATEYLGIATLGIPGANGWQDAWGLIFKDFLTVFVFADGDEAGKEFAHKVSDAIGWRARTVQCPDGLDVASMVTAGRSAELLAKMSTSNYEEG